MWLVVRCLGRRFSSGRWRARWAGRSRLSRSRARSRSRCVLRWSGCVRRSRGSVRGRVAVARIWRRVGAGCVWRVGGLLPTRGCGRLLGCPSAIAGLLSAGPAATGPAFVFHGRYGRLVRWVSPTAFKRVNGWLTVAWLVSIPGCWWAGVVVVGDVCVGVELVCDRDGAFGDVAERAGGGEAGRLGAVGRSVGRVCEGGRRRAASRHPGFRAGLHVA
jgi:hypothetical protein